MTQLSGTDQVQVESDRLDGSPRTSLLFQALYFIVVLVQSVFFVLTWNQPLLEQHGFRQTQTALTVYWAIRDGWRFAYETPVLGAPWSLPFEFPIYQWLVSILWKITGLPLDNTGRLVSFMFHLACSVVVMRLLLRLGSTRPAAWVTATAFLLAPVNAFWGRAFLIESCALFFSLCFVLLIAIAFPNRPAPASGAHWSLLPGLIVVGMAAALAKTTTFLIPLTLAGVLVLWWLGSNWRQNDRLGARELRRVILLYGVPAATSLGAAIVWTRFGDAVKGRSELTAWLASANLTRWNFGSATERFDRALWTQIVLGRSIPEAVGIATAVLLILVWIVFYKKPAVRMSILFSVAYLGTFLLLPNLHRVHDYYQYAVAVWLVCAAGFAFSAVSERSIAAFSVLALVLFAQQTHLFAGRHLPIMRSTIGIEHPVLELSQVIRAMTGPDDVIIVFGHGWSSELPYYSERRGIVVPDYLNAENLLNDPRRFSAPFDPTLIVSCGIDPRSDRGVSIERLRTGMPRNVSGCSLVPIGEHRAQ
jgi:hypothetical protein